MLGLAFTANSTVGRPGNGLEYGSVGPTLVTEQRTQVLLHGTVAEAHSLPLVLGASLTMLVLSKDHGPRVRHAVLKMTPSNGLR